MLLCYLTATVSEDKSSADCPSIVSEVFDGQLVNSIQCLSCNKVIHPFILLSCVILFHHWDSFCHCISKLLLQIFKFQTYHDHIQRVFEEQ